MTIQLVKIGVLILLITSWSIGYASEPIWTDGNSPLKNYNLIQIKGTTKPVPRFFSWDPDYRGPDSKKPTFYFIQSTRSGSRPIFVGYEHRPSWANDYKGIRRNYFRKNDGLLGQQRVAYWIDGNRYDATGQFDALEPPRINFPSSEPQLTLWEYFMWPNLLSESNYQWTVVNTFDSAGVTPGVMQMSAVDGKDLLQLLIHMIESPRFGKNDPNRPSVWFPEFEVKGGNLFYKKTPGSNPTPIINRVGRNPGWQQNEFLKLFNPGCWNSSEFRGGVASPKQKREMLEIDDQEIELTARWVLWTQSLNMRLAQHDANIQIVQKVVARFAYHRFFKKKEANLELEGTTGLDWACAYNLLHWTDSSKMQNAVKRMLEFDNPAQEFLNLRHIQTEKDVPDWISGYSKKWKTLKSRAENAYRHLHSGNQPNEACRNLLRMRVLFDYTGGIGENGKVTLVGTLPFRPENFVKRLVSPIAHPLKKQERKVLSSFGPSGQGKNQ